MAVREFNGTSDDLTVGMGAATGLTYGTVALLIKFSTVTDFRALFQINNSSNTFVSAPLTLTNFSTWELFYGASSDSGVMASTGIWYLAVVRKVTGSAAPRLSVYNYNTTTWAHANSVGGAVADASAAGAGSRTGFSFQNGSGDFFGGRVAAKAAWSNTLPWSADGTGDTALVAAGLHTSAQAWLDSNPSVFWLFNQASIATPVDDLSSGGTGDQISISGTTVIAGDDPPGFSFTLGGAGADANQWVPRPFAGPVPRLFRTGTRSPFQLMGDREVVVGTTPISLADTAVANDALIAAVAAPLTETASAADALSVAAALALADTATAADALTTATAVPLSDTATASDNLGVTAAINLSDTATAADALAVSATLTLSDTAGAVDVLTAGVPISLSDTAAANDSLVVTVTLPLTETASAADSLSVFTPGVIDSYQAGVRIAGMFLNPAAASIQLAGDRQPAVSGNQSISLSDTATATDALTITVALPLTETAIASDALAVTVALALADTASAVDALTAGVPISLSDTASALDSLSVQVTGSQITLTDTASASDSLTITVALALADTASALDALSIPEAPQQAVVSRVTTGHQMSRAGTGTDARRVSTGHQMSRISTI